jgi:hypothetical protein
MKHNIIKTNNYLLVVDDSQIKIGDIVLEKYLDGTIGLEQIDTLNDIHNVLHKKIIAHLPLNGASTLNGVDLLPPIEDDVERLAEEYSKNHSIYETAQDDVYHGFFQGYNKAKAKYKYTEEDMREAFKAGQLDKGNNWYGGDFIEFIKSLQQPKMPIGFEFETKDEYLKNGILIKTEWVGKYIFD